MKKLILILSLVTVAFLATAAQAPITYTQGPDTQWRQQVDPGVDPKSGVVTSWGVTAFFQAQFTNTADPTDTFFKQLGTAQIECVKQATKTVTFMYSGKSYTLEYGALAAGMAAAGAQEWTSNPQKVGP